MTPLRKQAGVRAPAAGTEHLRASLDALYRVKAFVDALGHTYLLPRGTYAENPRSVYYHTEWTSSGFTIAYNHSPSAPIIRAVWRPYGNEAYDDAAPPEQYPRGGVVGLLTDYDMCSIHVDRDFETNLRRNVFCRMPPFFDVLTHSLQTFGYRAYTRGAEGGTIELIVTHGLSAKVSNSYSKSYITRHALAPFLPT